MIELILRLYFKGKLFFRELWNLADVVLVVLSMLSTWIFPFVYPSTSTNLYVLSSTIRLVRIMTVGRLVRVLSGFRDLWSVIAGFVDAIKTLMWVSIFLIFILYIAAVFVTVEIGQNPDLYEPYKYVSGGWDYQDYFGSVGKSMFTLFQIVTLDDWSNGVARHVMSNQPAMCVFFLLFILLTSYGLMNIITGIIVERTLSAAKQNQQRFQRTQEKERARVLNHLREIFELADKDGNGSLTIDEFRTAIRQPDVERKLKLIELPVADAEELFEILDHDGSGELSVDEFIGGCVRLKGTARSKDLLGVQVNVQCLADRVETIELQLSQLEDNFATMDSKTKLMLEEARQLFS
jgi:voltage-gated sodium channel